MKSSPLILDSLDDPGRRLPRIEVAPNDPKNENWLQELLFTHPELLPVEDFSDSYAPPIPIGREVRTNRGPIDNMYVSPEGGITIVESKLWRNPEKHRTVVAQIIDYAKEVASWDYDELAASILSSSRRRGAEKTSLEELVAPLLVEGGVELNEFQENLAACLSSGNFLLLIVGDRISPNIALLTQAIQSAPGLGFALGLVEMQLYQSKPDQDWPLIVVPEVVGRTVEKTRGVVHIRYAQEKPEVTVNVEDTEDENEGAAQELDLEQFLREIPKDLTAAYREGIETWETQVGGLDFTGEMMFFVKEIKGKKRRVIRCRKYAVNILLPKHFEEWGVDPAIFEEYIQWLEPAPLLYDKARNNKMWVRYSDINANDLRILINAGIKLVQRLDGPERDV